MASKEEEALRHQAALKHHTLVVERVKRRQAISDTWKVKFKALVEENDRLEAELIQWFVSEYREVDAWLGDMLEGLQK